MTKLAPIPKLADYGLSSTYGFLPDTPPLKNLPNPYYVGWEQTSANLPALILAGKVRDAVHQLPILTIDNLHSEEEYRRAYSLLCFMTHAYIWGGTSPAERIPPAISVPLLALSRKLGVPPVGTYAALCLWNFKPLFDGDKARRLENLATLNTFTGSMDESWFYLVSVAIEARGAPIIRLMLKAIAAARHNNSDTVTRCLCTLAEHLTSLSDILQRMHENCEPTVFYHRIRPFLAGSKNMAHAGLPNGVIYEDGRNEDTYHQYSGGSNAQSSLIQFFDIALGVRHRPTGQKREQQVDSERDGVKQNFIHEMRRYMPGPHAQFLNDVEKAANIREYVEAHPKNERLCLAYDASLAMLSAFRDKHHAIVARYIITPSRMARPVKSLHGTEPLKRQLKLSDAPRKRQCEDNTQKGTGGTALIHFLKQAREETREPATHEWTKAFMKKHMKIKGNSTSTVAKAEIMEEDGELGSDRADSWTAHDIGGICQF